MMNNMILPEATLIDLKTVCKESQGRISRMLNYSKLFDIEKPGSYVLTSDISSKGFLCTYSIDLKPIDDKEMKFRVRPVFKYSEIKEYAKVIEELAPGYLLVTFGEYPFDEYPEPIRNNKKLKETGNKFTMINIVDGKPVVREYPEMIYEGQESTYIIKDIGRNYYGMYLYEVKPVYFLVDVKKDFAISKDVLFELPTLKSAKDVISYKETLPYEFLNKYFVPDLMQNIIKEKEQDHIETMEEPAIKELIDRIIETSKNSILTEVIKNELQNLINEYNSYIDTEKEEINNPLELKILSSEEIFIPRFENLFTKVINFPYYNDSKIIYECLNLKLEENKEITSNLYEDLFKIYKYILPSLPNDICESYKTKLKEVLENAKNLIISLYKNQNSEIINIELKVRAKLQPILESLYRDVTTNYININLSEIINGIFKSNKDKYLAYLFDLINECVREIEILIQGNKLDDYYPKLNELINMKKDIKTYEFLLKIYINLWKLKEEIEIKINRKEALERKKIKRKFI